jgi:gliding motility-associated-like protein
MKNKLLLLYTFIILGSLQSVASCPGDTVRFTSVAGACKNQTISFNNTSVGGFTTYFWDFGDGSTLADTSDVQNPPAYTYPSLGTYTATLIVDKGLPCADTFTAVVNMAYVTAAFSTNAPQCVTSAVVFTDASVAGSGGTITDWKWDFGDAGILDTSTAQNPSYTYATGNQTFFAKLVVTTSDGCKDSLTSGIGIQNAVVVNAGTNIVSCDNNLTVNLSGSIMNAGGGIWSASGSFSNNTSLTPIYTPTVNARQSGTDTVILTSFSSPYCPNKKDTVVITFNPGPTVNVGSDISVCKDTAGVPVTAVLTGATGGIWHTTSTEGTFANATNVTTTYFPGNADTAAGSVILYLESTGNGICSPVRDSLTITFTPLQTVLIKTQDTSCSGNPVLLDVAVSTGTGYWESTGTGLFLPNTTTLNGAYNPSAADNLAGGFTLMFTSTNNTGCQPARDTLDIVIKPSPVANFSAASACVESPVMFSDSSAVSQGTIVNWNWVFGDLSLPNTAPSPSHSYSSCGTKIVTLVVTASNGCIDSNIQNVPVYCLPVANYTATGVCLVNGTVFNDISVVTGSTIALSTWDFGDGAVGNTTPVTHSFPTSGSFPVKLITKTAQGCLDTLVQTIPVDAGPVAAFTISDNTADINQPIGFTDGSTAATGWDWNFGDGTAASTSESPTHTFTVGGIYNVCLIATDANSCADTICWPETVSALPQGPSAFSPNGDGKNDVFYVFGGPFKTLNFRVYNNWGELVFESNKQSYGWDGTFKGVDQPMGPYVYTVVAVTEDDKEYKTSGDVTLLR